MGTLSDNDKTEKSDRREIPKDGVIKWLTSAIKLSLDNRFNNRSIHSRDRNPQAKLAQTNSH